MGRILDYIAHETNGKCFTSFKYCYDDSAAPNIEYGSSQEDSYINMKEYAESIHDPNVRDMPCRALHFLNSSLMALVEFIK